MMRLLFLGLALMTLWAPVAVHAATYWAAPNGGDTTATTCASISGTSDPGVYGSIGRAAECATTSPWIINMKGTLGTYSQTTHAINTSTRHASTFASGLSSTNPNIIRTAPGETRAVLTVNPGGGNGWISMCCTVARNNITVDNFKWSSTAGTGQASAQGMWLAGNNWIIQNCEMVGPGIGTGNPASSWAISNLADVSLNGISSTHTIRNCVLHEFESYAIYGVPDHSIIENNEIYNTRNGGIQLQYDYDNTIVRNNYIHDIYRRSDTLPDNACNGIIFANYAAQPLNVGVQMYNNVIDAKCTGLTGPNAILLFDADAMIIANNTIILSPTMVGVLIGANVTSNVQVYNNIFSGGPASIWSGTNVTFRTADFNACSAAQDCVDSGGTKRTITSLLNCTVSSTDFHLHANSPNVCRNGGTTVAAVTTDKDLVPRPKESVYDVGAYEFNVGGGGGGTGCTGTPSGTGDQRLNFPGGFVENQNAAIRTKYTLAQINAIIPTGCGAFTWPAPYNTKSFRITDTSDCTGAADCQWYVGYSYWNNMNAHTNDTTMLIVLGSATNRGGTGMNLYRLDKTTDALTKLGPIFTTGQLAANGVPFRDFTGEGWFFSANPANPNILYVNDGPMWRRYNVITQAFTQTIFNVVTQFGASHIMQQLHTSADDTVHSMTLCTGTTTPCPQPAIVGCAVYMETTNTWRSYAKVGVFDECSLDKSGRWTILLEDHGTDPVDDSMRVCDNTTGTCVSIEEGFGNGTLAHFDTGYEYMVGADNNQALDHATIYWNFGPPMTKGVVIHSNNDPTYTYDRLNHLSHSNAVANIPQSRQMICGSNVDSSTLQNETTCVRVDGTAPLQQLIVAPLGGSLSATGGCCNSYAKEPKGNLDITGQYFLWSSNMGSSRLDHWLVKVPQGLLPLQGPTRFAPGQNLRRAP